MDLCVYQAEARKTKRLTAEAVAAPVIPLLGLASESGALLNEYKKSLRDGEAHALYQGRVTEELGDLLWYVSAVADVYGLSLQEVAEANLRKCQERWGGEVSAGLNAFDSDFPAEERLPRCFAITLETVVTDGAVKMRMLMDGVQLGSALTDNAYENTGYRFHDLFHLTCAATLGWSPVIRTLLKRKRKSRPAVDEVEDGGRAAAIEEGISALVFGYAEDHGYLNTVHTIDYELLRTVKRMTKGLEVEAATMRDWERTILLAFEVWREIEYRGAGTVVLDLNERMIRTMPMI